MSRAEKIFVIILMSVAGLLPVFLYPFILQNPTPSGSFRASLPWEQWLSVITAMAIKPLYTALSLLILIILWKQDSLALKSIKWAMAFFFIGENFCAADYFFSPCHDSHFLEYMHNLGMMLCFSFTVYSIFEGADRHLISYSDAQKTCSLVILCRQCIKYKNVPCAFQRCFILLGFAGAIVALMPMCAQIQIVFYSTEILGSPYIYHHPLVSQLFETRYCPALACVLFLASSLLLLIKHHNPVHWAKILFSGACGAAGFSFLRFVIFYGFLSNLLWMDFWEEATELLFIVSVAMILWIFRKSIFKSEQAGKP
jgi:hypothetical protein